ncbi:hypothetical protein Peur_040095 [Populus x canadensis]
MHPQRNSTTSPPPFPFSVGLLTVRIVCKPPPTQKEKNDRRQCKERALIFQIDPEGNHSSLNTRFFHKAV